MNDINTSFNGTSGVNPESDASHITLEYDTNSDKFYLDTGELTPYSSSKLPILGSPTDSSNFLHAIRLLDLQTEDRDADIETNSGISLFNPGDGIKAWLADNDPLLTSDDSRKFASFGGSLFKRQ